MKQSTIDVEIAIDESDPSIVEIRVSHSKGKALTMQAVVDAVSDALLLQWAQVYRADETDLHS